jgi:hypothetical protein
MAAWGTVGFVIGGNVADELSSKREIIDRFLQIKQAESEYYIFGNIYQPENWESYELRKAWAKIIYIDSVATKHIFQKLTIRNL